MVKDNDHPTWKDTQMALFEFITKEYLNIDTLETRGSDRLDFHTVSVTGVCRALSAAFSSGRNEGMGRNSTIISFPQVSDTRMLKIIDPIAQKHLRVDTLETRNSDGLDFYDVGVAGLRRAFSDVYAAGVGSVVENRDVPDAPRKKSFPKQ